MTGSGRIAALALMAGMAGCTPASGPPPPSPDTRLTASIWRVEDINHAGIMDFAFLSMDFNAEGRMFGEAGCNTFTGSYEIGDDGQIEIGPLATTRKLCTAEALMLQEARFLETLGMVERYSFEETGALYLEGPEGKSVLALPVD